MDEERLNEDGSQNENQPSQIQSKTLLPSTTTETSSTTAHQPSTSESKDCSDYNERDKLEVIDILVENINKSLDSLGSSEIVEKDTAYGSLSENLKELLDLFKLHQQDTCLKKGSQLDADASFADQTDCYIEFNDDFDYINTFDDDEESFGDDSDDESLCNKLCTYSSTQKEFINQHWYHCYTCNMIDRVGVCSICAKVCHKDHDVTYSRFGAFFCDCAAKENGSCVAMNKRSNSKKTNQNLRRQMLNKNSESKLSSNNQDEIIIDKVCENTAEDSISNTTVKHDHDNQILNDYKSARKEFIDSLVSNGIPNRVAELVKSLIPIFIEYAHDESYHGRCLKVKNCLQELHLLKKPVQMTEDLMLPTLGSQEGAFENVRVSYSGKHASVIRQLLTSNTLKRVSMTSLSSTMGKRHHLVVCHEKGKITLLQLSTLLRQADSSKRKLTLTRIAYAPVPFSVISVVANSFNEDVLAVCGLQECHVLTFTSNGFVSSYIEIDLDISDSYFHIIKAIWLPGSESRIAIITPSLILIYDLFESSTKAKHKFCLITGSVKDISFIVSETDNKSYLLTINSLGKIYCQALDFDRELQNDEVHTITSEIYLESQAFTIVDDCRNEGGISIYYSHPLKLLFFSFANGTNFLASLNELHQVSNLSELEFTFYESDYSKSCSSSQSDDAPQQTSIETVQANNCSKKQKSKPQPLCQWSEITGHFGLVMAFCLYSNNPVVLMLKPDSIIAQEIRYTNLKSKITDATAIRHLTSSGEERTTLILLCEDGSLRIYMASQENTDYWSKKIPFFNAWNWQPKTSLAIRMKQRRSWFNSFVPKPSKQVSFPLEFFESCEVLNCIEFAGNDILNTYNTQQVKTRLNTTGMHIASRKPTGFGIDIINTSADLVVCGVRIEVGCQEVEKAPQYIEMFNRRINISPKIARWYDIPFTREESILSEKKFTINFGPSRDQSNVTIIDSMKVYGKIKESFSWPEDLEEYYDLANFQTNRQEENVPCHSASFQMLFVRAIDALKNILVLDIDQSIHQDSLTNIAPRLCESLLTVPYSKRALRSVKDLLISLYSSRDSFNQQRDTVTVDFVRKTLRAYKNTQIDPELLSKIVSITRSLCLSSPSNLIKVSSAMNNSEENYLDDQVISFLKLLSNQLSALNARRSYNAAMSSVASMSSINLEETLSYLIDILYIASKLDPKILCQAASLMKDFLIDRDFNVALCARKTLIKLLKDYDDKSNVSDHKHHHLLLDEFIGHLRCLKDLGGYRSVSFLHIVLLLFLELDCEQDPRLVHKLLTELVQELLPENNEEDEMLEKSNSNELKLLIMRMLSIMMSKIKASTVTQSSNTKLDSMNADSLSSTITAQYLARTNVLDYCYVFLQKMIPSWKDINQFNLSSQPGNLSGSSEMVVTTHRETLHKNSSFCSAPDLTPFFQRQFAKGTDPFDEFRSLITEMAVRLPYQIRKLAPMEISESNTFEEWNYILCEYLLTSIPSTIKKHVRKLLTFICGSKEKYRQLRDFHSLNSHMSEIVKICQFSSESNLFDVDNHDFDYKDLKPLDLSYDLMTKMVEHLKACIEVGQNRGINWQIYCSTKDQKLLPFLLRLSLYMNEEVASVILDLLEHAFNDTQVTSKQVLDILMDESSNSPLESAQTDQCLKDALTSKSLSAKLTQQLINATSKGLISRFVLSFLLETHQTSIRWQAHSLISNMWNDLLPEQQLEVVLVFWSLWHKIPRYGRKASTFVDLISFITANGNDYGKECEEMFCHEVLNILRQQNQMLMNHPNAHLYRSLQSLVDFDGYYLESDPCPVCNSPDVQYISYKLNSIKVDSKFTTTSNIVKLVGSYTILRFSLKILDIKRSKMVKTIQIHYNNKPVQSVVELKNKTGIWNSTRKYTLSPAQTDVKIDFTLPITACNLLIEFVDFYENIQASNETLQCPRCSTNVSANPGVCGNCGENVFQCHKCRSINYDERDPFLCYSCGFCKYARFDIMMIARPTCESDPLENEGDRKKTLSLITNLLDKADRYYKNISQSKPTLEYLVSRVQEQIYSEKVSEVESDTPLIEEEQDPITLSSQAQQSTSMNTASSMPNTSASAIFNVNKAIQHLAQKYCVECRTHYKELAKTTHKVSALRRKLIEYDTNQLKLCSKLACNIIVNENRKHSRAFLTSTSFPGKCFGCGNATVEHCLSMLKALICIPRLRAQICDIGLINELVVFNLWNGPQIVNQKVRKFLMCLTDDDVKATEILTELLMKSITSIGNLPPHAFEINPSISNELTLLTSTLDTNDQCWELKLKCLFKIFMMSLRIKNPSAIDCITIPCMKMFLGIIVSESSLKKKTDKQLEDVASVRTDQFRGKVLLGKWLETKSSMFTDWRKRSAKPTVILRRQNYVKQSYQSKPTRQDKAREYYLSEKYGNLWKFKASKFNQDCHFFLNNNSWLGNLLFHPSSKSARILTKSLIEALFSIQGRRKQIIDLLTDYLSEVAPSSECSHEFFILYKSVIRFDHWRYYLALKGIMVKLCEMLSIEIEDLQELEETTLSSNLSQGFSLKMLVDILATFFDDHRIVNCYKQKLIGFILKGYISLRRLVIQRTKMIDEAQGQLLSLLEGMTSGNEEETAAFITVCVEAIKNCQVSDIRTPIFIFERLCSTIQPDESSTNEFFVSIEKDPQQEDYLQGRMVGNPYSSNEPGIGPLMKDIKNRICRDCELLALLEDDSSMELIVSNKIISLDLSLEEVYKRVWCPENCETEPMRIIYRMRGLLGDATEEFIENLYAKNDEEVDEEKKFKMANVMRTCDGLETIIERLKQIEVLSPPFNSSLEVILKLFGYCVKVKENRLKLLETGMDTINILLETLKLTIKGEKSKCIDQLVEDTSNQSLATPGSISFMNNNQSQLIEGTLAVLEPLLKEIATNTQTVKQRLDLSTCGKTSFINFILNIVQLYDGNSQKFLNQLINIVPMITFGDEFKMKAIIDFFEESMDFKGLDLGNPAASNCERNLDLFCRMIESIIFCEHGNQLKDYIAQQNIVTNSINYLIDNAPRGQLMSGLMANSDEWLIFTSKPALKYIMRLLTGMCRNHPPTQLSISSHIAIIHNLEQVSSETHVGTLAENLLEAIKQHPAVEEKIQEIRRQTREEKKKLAMAVRARQLGELGMKANDRGQVISDCKLLEQCQDLYDETGLVCNICREGYKFQPKKIMGIYTYTKRCLLDEYELKPRKTYGFTTVTHFNTVHIDCHMAAIKSARSRDEWDSAALQNANTRCNGLLPIWGPEVSELAFATCLVRHNSYIQDCTGNREVTLEATIHDIRFQLLRFAQERSFSEDTGGGGPQSNLHLVPYMMQIVLYNMNSNKTANRRYKKVLNHLDISNTEILENCYETESPFYWITVACLVLPPSWWKKKRIEFLKRLLICNHVRRVGIKPPLPITDSRVRAYSYYKSALIYFSLIDSFQSIVFKDAVRAESWDKEWTQTLASYLRYNDQAVNDNIEVLFNLYQDVILPCQSIDRYFEIIHLDEVNLSPSEFLSKTIAMNCN